MDESTAMLFCPPLAPFRLEGSGPFTLGRSRDCDFPIAQGDISRQHAQIERGGDQWVVRDLGSTNGSFVNGRRIEGAQSLAPGDRVELGAATITFCVFAKGMEAVAGDLDGGQTVVFDRAPAADAFSGDLAEIPTFAVFQVLEMGMKSGVLEIQSASDPGRIWFKQGAPRHAETEKETGWDAAMALAHVAEGKFAFTAEFVSVEATIEASVTELLLEASRTLDEAGR